MMITTKRVSSNFQNIREKLDKELQQSFCEYENTITQYEDFIRDIFKLLQPNIICRYDDEELYSKICQLRFTDYQQRKFFDKSFYIKKPNGRFIEIEEILVNATESEIEKIKQDIELLTQENENLGSLEENNNDNIEKRTMLFNQILRLQKDLRLIEYSKKHKTNQYPLFDDIYQNPPKEFFLENKNIILTKLHKNKEYITWFENKKSFDVYDLIDWENIEFLATFDCKEIQNAIKKYKLNHSTYKKLFEVDEIFNFNKLVKIYNSSSFNKKEELVNVIGSIHNNKINWKLNKNYYNINMFVMIKASKSLINEKNSWDIIGFEESIKQWKVKGACLSYNAEALRHLFKSDSPNCPSDFNHNRSHIGA